MRRIVEELGMMNGPYSGIWYAMCACKLHKKICILASEIPISHLDFIKNLAQ